MATSLSLPTSSAEADEFISRPQKRVIEAFRSIEEDVLVLGAGGKMGLHLSMMARMAFDILGLSNRVIAVSRFNNLRSTEAFTAKGIETIPCDLTDIQQLENLPLVPNIIYMAGAKFGTAGNPELLQQMNVEVPKLVAQRFSKSRIVAYSTGCVYSYISPESNGSVEESLTEPPGKYALSCLGREQAFTQVSKDQGTQVALIRLNYAVEFHYGVLVDICQKVFRDEPVEVSMGYVNLIWQGDAIAYSLMALPYCDSPPFILNVTGSPVLSVRDCALRFGKILGKKVQITGEEKPTAWLSSAAKSYRLFGPPEVSLDEMMEWIAKWITTIGTTYGKPTGFQIRDGKY